MSKKQMNTSVKSLIVLFSICLIVAVAMAAINQVTAPKIAEAEAEAEQEALRQVLPAAEEFLRVEGEFAESIASVWRASDGCGYAVMLAAKGYDSSKPMSIAVGFDEEGPLLSCRVVSASGETSGIGTKVCDESFLNQFVGKDEHLDGVDAISGATISSSAPGGSPLPFRTDSMILNARLSGMPQEIR